VGSGRAKRKVHRSMRSRRAPALHRLGTPQHPPPVADSSHAPTARPRVAPPEGAVLPAANEALRGTAHEDHLARKRQKQRCVMPMQVPVGNRTRVAGTFCRPSTERAGADRRQLRPTIRTLLTGFSVMTRSACSPEPSVGTSEQFRSSSAQTPRKSRHPQRPEDEARH